VTPTATKIKRLYLKIFIELDIEPSYTWHANLVSTDSETQQKQSSHPRTEEGRRAKENKKYKIKNRDKTRDKTVDIAQNSNRGRIIKSSAGRKKQEEKHHARQKLPKGKRKPAYSHVQRKLAKE
jgi:hypothetical protein